MPGLINNSGAQQEPHCLSEKAKRGLPKVYQSELRLLQGTDDFKRQILVPMCIRHQDKSYNTYSSRTLLPLYMRWSRQWPIPFKTENRKSQGPGKGEKKRDKACSDAVCPPGKPYHKPQLLEDRAQGKCLACRQAGHWAKECPNCDKYPKMACYKCHQLGH